MENSRPQSYVQRFLAVSSKVERLFFRAGMFGFIGIVASQLLLMSGSLRSILTTVDALEGEKLTNSSKAAASSETARELLIAPVSNSGSVRTWVKINGIPVVQIADKQVSVKVNNGDVLQIDTPQADGVSEFEIDHNDPAITSPAPGTRVETTAAHSAVIGPVLFQQ